MGWWTFALLVISVPLALAAVVVAFLVGLIIGTAIGQFEQV